MIRQVMQSSVAEVFPAKEKNEGRKKKMKKVRVEIGMRQSKLDFWRGSGEEGEYQAISTTLFFAGTEFGNGTYLFDFM